MRPPPTSSHPAAHIFTHNAPVLSGKNKGLTSLWPSASISDCWRISGGGWLSRRTTTSPPAESLSHSVSGRGQRSGVRGQADGGTRGLGTTELQKQPCDLPKEKTRQSTEPSKKWHSDHVEGGRGQSRRFRSEGYESCYSGTEPLPPRYDQPLICLKLISGLCNT